jgi:hypothetical protein
MLAERKRRQGKQTSEKREERSVYDEEIYQDRAT